MTEEALSSTIALGIVALFVFAIAMKRAAIRIVEDGPPSTGVNVALFVLIFAWQFLQHWLAQDAVFRRMSFAAGVGSILFFPCTFVILHLVCSAARAHIGSAIHRSVVWSVVIGNCALVGLLAGLRQWSDLRMVLTSAGALVACLAIAYVVERFLAAIRWDRDNDVDRVLIPVLFALVVDSILYSLGIAWHDQKFHLNEYRVFLNGHLVGKLIVGLILVITVKNQFVQILAQAKRETRSDSFRRAIVMTIAGFTLCASSTLNNWLFAGAGGIAVVWSAVSAARIDRQQSGATYAKPETRKVSAPQAGELSFDEIERRYRVDFRCYYPRRAGQWVAYLKIGGERLGPKKHLSTINRKLDELGIDPTDVVKFRLDSPSLRQEECGLSLDAAST